jgi:type IV secretion system protein VirB5
MSQWFRSPCPRHLCRPLAIAALCLGAAGASQAQGIPVIDTANLIQTIQQVVNDITKINNQVQQITQLQQQVTSMNGSRLLGMVQNSPELHNYVPANAFNLINAVNTGGYGGLTSTGKSLRDLGMVYNCLDMSGDARTACQAALAQPYQQKGLLQDAMASASGRLGQITALMGQIDATTDQKAIEEIQARLGAENAMLAHEVSQVQMLQGMADSEERIARSRERELQYQSLRRNGKLAEHLP